MFRRGWRGEQAEWSGEGELEKKEIVCRKGGMKRILVGKEGGWMRVEGGVKGT